MQQETGGVSSRYSGTGYSDIHQQASAQPLDVIENPLYDSGTTDRRPWTSGTNSAPVSRQTSENQRTLPNLRRTLSRSKTIKDYVKRNTATFFGVNSDTEAASLQRWTDRRKRMLSKRYGNLKDQEANNESVQFHSNIAASAAPLPAASSSWNPTQRNYTSVSSAESGVSTVSCRQSQVSASPPKTAKDPVYKLTWNGLRLVAKFVSQRMWPHKAQQSRNLARHLSYIPSVGDGTSIDSRVPPGLPQNQDYSVPDGLIDDVFFEKSSQTDPNQRSTALPPSMLYSSDQLLVKAETPAVDEVDAPRPLRYVWHRPLSVDDQDVGELGLTRIWNKALDKAFDNSDRRQYGMGIVGSVFRRSFRQEKLNQVKDQLNDLNDHRPYFTYWVTFVQILIAIITLAVYGFGPVGFHKTQRSSLVLVTSLSLQQVAYFEPDNFWIGPRAADLVHLGAKFTPCMRKDRHIYDAIYTDREKERATACCVRNDQSGCVQSSRDKCSEIISTWRKWDSRAPGPPRWILDPQKGESGHGIQQRLSGSVCGQDPRYCEEPASVYPYEWPDDITKWPICRKQVTKKPTMEMHMACEVIGRPCCIDIYGRCKITTKEYCEFVRGYFHEEAALCSQVTCLDDVCGMIPFYTPGVPDQIYRLWMSLFLHAGIVHLCVTVIIQYTIMRDLEKLIGPLRIGILYMVSGMAGNLASAVFVPYRAEVGPAGSQFGLLACLFVEVIHCWPMLKHPGMALLRLAGVALVLFLLGLLPWVDNYAHLSGFIIGFLLSYALLPFVSFGLYDRTRKVILIWACLAVVLVLVVVLIIWFYIHPLYECTFCKYLTCIPLIQDFCELQSIELVSRTDL